MFVLLPVGVSFIAVIGCRIALGRWFNHLSVSSAICCVALMVVDGRLLGRSPVSGSALFYIFAGWLLCYMGSLTVLLVRGLPVRKAGSARAWESKYRCRLPDTWCASGNRSSIAGWGIIALLVMQSLLLGTSDEMDAGKLAFAAIYLLFLAVWMGQAWVNIRAGHEPLLFWTTALLALGMFSRLPGMFSGIPSGDWMRDFMPLLHFSWILVGPFAFRGRSGIWRGYLVFLAIDAVLTFVVTDQYLMIRQFRADGWGLIEYIHTTDAVVLFGAFMAAPMTGLPIASKYRVGFGFMAAAFVVATLLTGTRSHLGALVAGMIFYFWLTKRTHSKAATAGRRALLASVLVGASAFSMVLSSGLLNVDEVMKRTQEMSSADFGALTQRLDESLAAWNGFVASPVVGQGLGYRMPMGLWSIAPSDDDLFMIHNFYLYVLLKFGILGVPIFVGFLVSMIRSAISAYRQATDPFDQAFAAGLAALIVALLVESATAPRFQDRTATALLSLLVACLLSLRREIALRHMSVCVVPCQAGLPAKAIPGMSPA